jgi:hypothetical protein
MVAARARERILDVIEAPGIQKSMRCANSAARHVGNKYGTFAALAMQDRQIPALYPR